MIDLNSYTEIDTTGMNRDTAVLIYNNKVYFDDNHQYALEKALNEEGKSMEMDFDKELDIAADITHNMSRDNKICTLDIWVDRKSDNNISYLVAHFEEHLKFYWNYIIKIATENNMIIGAFAEFSQKTFRVYKEDILKSNIA